MPQKESRPQTTKIPTSASVSKRVGGETTRWFCPAKLNLFLHLTGRREDDYHNLQSVFQLLDFGDWLEIELSDTNIIEFDCNQPELCNNDNLVVSAVEHLQKYASQRGLTTTGAKIKLDKKLPVGGGVGGGSSNCASALLAFNQLWQLDMDPQALLTMGLSLGADVPFFIHANTAFVEGIGEILTPVEMAPAWFLVVCPPVHVSTAKIFSNPLLTRNSKAITIRDLDALGLPFSGFNTLEAIVCNDYPEVKAALNWLKQFNQQARMTGTGSCVFAAFDNEREVSKIASRCNWPHFVARGINQSPRQQKNQVSPTIVN